MRHGVLMRRDVAEELNRITIQCTEKMGRARDIVMENCDGDEFKKYMRDIADALAAITMLTGRIYAEYPELIPPQMREPGGHA
jgi:hypothetical protein